MKHQHAVLILSIIALGTTALIFLYPNQDSHINLPQDTQYCAAIGKTTSPSLSETLAPYRKYMSNQTGVFPLETGNSAILTRAWLSEAAENSIDVQYFIFSRDNVGLIAFNYLVRAAQRGVKVRVLVDDFMLEFEEQEILALAAHPNIEIKIFNPGVNLGKNIFEKAKKFVTDFRAANHRMHNKLFVVDGEVLITGGRNIEGMYFDFDHYYNFRDRDVLLIGHSAREGQDVFEQYWKSSLSVDVSELLSDVEVTKDFQVFLSNLNEYACNPENYWPQIREEVKNLPSVFKSIEVSESFVWTQSASLICDSPEKNLFIGDKNVANRTTQTLVKLINEAQQTIDVQTPYLVTTESTRQIFSKLVAKGVSIRILTNSLASTDNIEAFSGYQRDREELLGTGVEVYEFKPDALVRFDIAQSALLSSLGHTAIFGIHAKTMVIDDRITVIGTFNLDPRSANLNTECLAIIDDKAIADSVLAGMEEEFQPENSWRVTKDWNPDKEVDLKKRIRTRTRYVIPKDVL